MSFGDERQDSKFPAALAEERVGLAAKLWDLGEDAREKLEDVEFLPLWVAGQRVVVGRVPFIEESAGAFVQWMRERERGHRSK